MKFLKEIVKKITIMFFYPFKRNKKFQKYLFTEVLQEELREYVNNDFYSGYEHIESSIKIGNDYVSKISNPVIVDVGGSTGYNWIILKKISGIKCICF